MGKWDKYKKNKDNNKEENNTSKTNINCDIGINGNRTISAEISNFFKKYVLHFL